MPTNYTASPWELAFGRKREELGNLSAQRGPALFARSPSDAVQLVSDFVSTARRLHDALSLAPQALRESPLVSLYGNDEQYSYFMGLLLGIPVFWWTQGTSDLVFDASRSYPLGAEEAAPAGGLDKPPAYFPRVPRGIAVFERSPLSIELEQAQVPLSALIWGIGINKRREACLRMYGVTWRPKACSVVFESHGGTAGGTQTMPEEDPNQTFQAERLMLARWICAAAMFVEQELVQSTPTNIERHAAKRAKTVLAELPQCHVVTLRREATESTIDTESGIVEWSHRWLVRGHWRNQFFPSRGANAPVWIHPHVKGPADKPFVEPRETVFRVAR